MCVRIHTRTHTHTHIHTWDGPEACRLGSVAWAAAAAVDRETNAYISKVNYGLRVHSTSGVRLEVNPFSLTTETTEWVAYVS